MSDDDLQLPPHLEEQVQHARDEGHRAADEKLPPPAAGRSRAWRLAIVALGLLVIAAVVVLGVVAIGAQDAAKDAKDRARDSNDSVTALADQVRGLGATPVATPSSGAQGPQGETGPGPSDDQVDAAVSRYCAIRSGCVGTPSPTDVAVAVRSYCSTGRCKGETGATGQRGASGSAGPSGSSGASGAPGQNGSSPSSADVAAAVAAYCDDRGGCTGPAGPKGDTGATGTAGRGISSVDCTGLGVTRLRITYSDGTTQDVPCDLDPPTSSAPSGTETP